MTRSIVNVLVLTGFFGVGVLLGHWTSDTILEVHIVRVPTNNPCIVIQNLQHNQNLPNGDYCYTDLKNLPKGV